MPGAAYQIDNWALLCARNFAGVAQLLEQLICIQETVFARFFTTLCAVADTRCFSHFAFASC
jgi:hypothetical protein